MTPSSHEEFLARRSFGSLDGIRCLSIVAVVWHHTVIGVDWLPATERGFLGVDMFFVLSGFLIVTLLLRERDRTGAISLRKFYARRSLRIFPAYYGVLIAMAIALKLLRRGALAGPFFDELPYLATYTSNWVPINTLLALSWSLAAEQQFYLLWPPIEKLAGKLVLPILFLVIGANQLLNFRLVDAETLARVAVHLDLPMWQATFTPICLGVLVAHLLHSRRGFDAMSRALSSRIASPLALALVVALSALPAADISGWHRLLIQSAIAALLCTCVVRKDHGLRRLLEFPPIARVGVISYGVYLYHPFARHAAVLLLDAISVRVPLALFATCLALTIAMSEVSYRYYETPFLRMKDWFQSRVDPARRGARA
ncbi:MAG: acyltransferase family protein [Myxococcota bacterium]